MIARKVTEQEMYKAIRETAAQYAGNVKFKTFTPKGKGFNFTLTVHKAADAGGRRSAEGRKIAAACWHVHRDFMRNLYTLNPAAVIISSFARYEGRADFEETHGTTGDRNIGSGFNPQSYRNACKCTDDTEGRDRAEQAAQDDADRRMGRVAAAIPGHAAEMRRALAQDTKERIRDLTIV